MAFRKVSPRGANVKDNTDAERAMGPGVVDQLIRQALQMAWMMLPPERQTVDHVEREFRRISDRALRDLREDSKAFGRGAGSF